MQKIPLTRGLFALVDDSDFDELNQYRWHAHERRSRNLYEAQRHLQSERRDGKWVSISVTMSNHLIPHEAGLVIDHIDGNPLNNQRSNLRLATRHQNAINWSRKGTSFGRGIFLNGKKYGVRIVDPTGYRRYLGAFHTVAEASQQYAKHAKALHGEFARFS